MAVFWGTLAVQKQINWLQLLIMNLSVFAGSSQFVMVEMGAPPLPIVKMTLAVLVINFRYLLLSASLRSIFQDKSLLHKFVMIYLVADENWAITMAEYRRGTASTYFLLGGALTAALLPEPAHEKTQDISAVKPGQKNSLKRKLQTNQH